MKRKLTSKRPVKFVSNFKLTWKDLIESLSTPLPIRKGQINYELKGFRLGSTLYLKKLGENNYVATNSPF